MLMIAVAIEYKRLMRKADRYFWHYKVSAISGKDFWLGMCILMESLADDLLERVYHE